MRSISLRHRAEGRSIGFVPTMGFLHEGHLSLVDRAKDETDIIVVSIFVNPTQFGPNEDLDSYPRDEKRDMELLEDRGVDYLFLPQPSEIYPEGHSTWVDVEGLTEGLCGRDRPTHFRGVTTVVTILFNIVLPDIAVFGQKDAQQAFVIRRMTHDLFLLPKIIVAPTIRHEDGLAMSSRNKYLTADERRAAPTLRKALLWAEHMVKEGENDAAKIKSAIKDRISEQFTIDYIELVETDLLRPVNIVEDEVLIAIAARIGRARLIDNIIVKPDLS